MSTQRSDRVADVVRQALAEIIQRDSRDPRIGFVTVTGVKLSPDLRHARVFISALESEDSCGTALEALNNAAPFYRKTLASRTRLRFIPRLKFYSDSGVERGRRIEELLREINLEGDEQ